MLDKLQIVKQRYDEDEYKTLLGNIEEAKEIIADGSDEEMVEMAKMQFDEASEHLPKLEEQIKYMLRFISYVH